MTEPADSPSNAGGAAPAKHSAALVSWWAAAMAVAATYFYFLLFAEFAFLELIRGIGPSARDLQLVMLALGAGGVAGAAGAARWFQPAHGAKWLAGALRACAGAATLALLARAWWMAMAAGVAVGLSLGALTVVLTASLRSVTGGGRLGLCIGLGTGLAYGTCNLPGLFAASAGGQTLAAALVALAASFLPRIMQWRELAPAARTGDHSPGGVVGWVVILLALVWMDSAAFYIIQHATSLRAATWEGAGTLYGNAFVHFAAAAAAGLWLDRGRRAILAAGATILLGAACLILNGMLPAGVPARWFYTAGVSLYSTVLVEFPARTSRAGPAALVFAVAGWIGSALGIGMAQDLAQVPATFVFAAGAAIALALTWRARRLRLAAVAAVALGGARVNATDVDPLVRRGREVYIAEGCLHCHSQYVRPQVLRDVERWGPPTNLPAALAAEPPLFGNRRQGPDLANVGNRRSPEWNRLHLIAPREVSPGTRMPSYAHLFATGDSRGEALVAYLASLGADTVAARQAQTAAWRPDPQQGAPLPEARRLFVRLCSSCHGETGSGNGPLAGRLSVRPPDWSQAEWRHVPPAADVPATLGRIIKFGLIGLPMAGHEYLPDGDVVGLANYVQTLHKERRTAAGTAVQP